MGNDTATNSVTQDTWTKLLAKIFDDRSRREFIAARSQPVVVQPAKSDSEKRIIAQTRALLKVSKERSKSQRLAAAKLLRWLESDQQCSSVLSDYLDVTLPERCSRTLTQFGLLLELSMPPL